MEMTHYISEDGENMAVKLLISEYIANNNITIEEMRRKFINNHFEGLWPNWVSYFSSKMEQSDFQNWLWFLYDKDKDVGIDFERESNVSELISSLKRGERLTSEQVLKLIRMIVLAN